MVLLTLTVISLSAIKEWKLYSSIRDIPLGEFKSTDANNDNKLNFDEFVKLFRKLKKEEYNYYYEVHNDGESSSESSDSEKITEKDFWWFNVFLI